MRYAWTSDMQKARSFEPAPASRRQCLIHDLTDSRDRHIATCDDPAVAEKIVDALNAREAAR